MLPIQALYVDRLTHSTWSVPRVLPSIRGWTSKFLKQREAEEINWGGGFGRGVVEASLVDGAISVEHVEKVVMRMLKISEVKSLVVAKALDDLLEFLNAHPEQSSCFDRQLIPDVLSSSSDIVPPHCRAPKKMLCHTVRDITPMRRAQYPRYYTFLGTVSLSPVRLLNDIDVYNWMVNSLDPDMTKVLFECEGRVATREDFMSLISRSGVRIAILNVWASILKSRESVVAHSHSRKQRLEWFESRMESDLNLSPHMSWATFEMIDLFSTCLDDAGYSSFSIGTYVSQPVLRWQCGFKKGDVESLQSFRMYFMKEILPSHINVHRKKNYNDLTQYASIVA
nr:uncharacterized protein LOC109185567 [Ipomoea batatas]